MEIAHDYEIHITWTEGKKGEVGAPSLPAILTAVAPPFPGGVSGVWSPEHLFVASLNACLMTTFLVIAENSKLKFDAYACRAMGKLEKMEDRLVISEVRLEPVIRVPHEKDVPRAERIIIKSKNMCIISNSVRSKILLEPKILTSAPRPSPSE